MKCAHYVVTPEHPIKDKQKFSGYINISLLYCIVLYYEALY